MGKLFWQKKELAFKSGSDSIRLNVRLVPFWYEGIGLMFKNKKNAKPLLFSYGFSSKMGIFSYFIPFNFLAVWVDKNNYVVESKIIKPRTKSVIPKKRFTKLIEIPVLKRYSVSLDFFNENKNNKIELFCPR